MAFNGITMRALSVELRDKLIDSHISKIAQPEDSELILTIKLKRGTCRLLISANASLPLIYLTEENKKSPDTAPNFCMLLRKHIGNGRICEIEQIGLERVIRFSVEHRDEMGDLSVKYLYVEIMGKHSNIIFTDSDNKIIDSIKHISSAVSSVREVLPGRQYFIPAQDGKIDPMHISENEFLDLITEKNQSIKSLLSGSFTGFSTITSLEICARAGLDIDQSTASLDTNEINKLKNSFMDLIEDINQENFSPTIIFDNDTDRPIEYSAFSLMLYSDKKSLLQESISSLLYNYYSRRDIYTNMHQRSTDLRKIVSNLLSRNVKKYSLQMKQYKDTEKKDIFRLRGELLRAYAYSIDNSKPSVTVQNYETGTDIEIPIQTDRSIMENANDYFSKYQKLKRTEAELKEQIETTSNTINHLESIQTALDLSENEGDLDSIRSEMEETGYIHKKKTLKKKKTVKDKPLHFRTKDDFDIYVGKNNYQNDYVTFNIAKGNDWWFHVKNVPGSHVIVKTEGRELPDHVFTDCAALAGFYSSEREADKIEIDYLKAKDVKKPNGSAPGYVVYYTNFSMVIKPGINDLEKITD
jgi:predicted ribosome quality control (RQC) complex YloA/Tae2 family protein